VSGDVCVIVRAELWLLSELTVPVGVGNTNGVVGVPEVDVDVDVGCLSLTVLILVVEDVLRGWSSEEGRGRVAVSEEIGVAKEPVIDVRRNAGENCWYGSDPFAFRVVDVNAI